MTPIALSPPSPEESLPSSPTLAPLKRKHSALEDPTTPPLAIEEDAEKASIIARATHVLATEATALSHVSRLYQTDRCAQKGLLRAVETIVDVNTKKGGKLVVCGVGKSGLVGMKTVATMKSLGLAASWMHAGEAMHGDLGDLRDVRRRTFPPSHSAPSERWAILRLGGDFADKARDLARTMHSYY